jgi:DNA-binding transcriptional MerR regulator
MTLINWTRRRVARELGLTYSTLRVYERHLVDLLVLSQGPNRTTLYDVASVDLLREAVALKKEGLPFSKLRDYFRGRLAPRPRGERAPTLAEIHSKTQAILSIGKRIEERLQHMEQLHRSLIDGGPEGSLVLGKGEGHV